MHFIMKESSNLFKLQYFTILKQKKKTTVIYVLT